MDKNSLAGLLLVGVIIFGFTWFSSRERAKAMEEQARIEATRQVEEQKYEDYQPTLPSPDQDSTVNDALAASMGETLFASMQGAEEFYKVENDVMEMYLSNKGGRVASVTLKDYKTYKGGPLVLFDKETSEFNLSLYTNQKIETSQFYFTPVTGGDYALAEGEESGSYALRLYVDSTSYIEYVYTLKQGEYMVGFDINLVGMESKIDRRETSLGLSWKNTSFQNEKGFDNENNYTTISYMYPDEKSPEQLGMSKASKSEEIKSRVKWFDFKQQFFSSALIAENGFESGSIGYTTDSTGGKMKRFTADMVLAYTPGAQGYQFNFYFGPNKYSILKKYDLGMEKVIPLGGWIIGWVNRWIVIPVFDLLSNSIASYGLIILILTLIIKLLIFPLTYKSYLSTAKMRLLKPEMDEISARYPKKEDAIKKQQATMELYKRAGVSPMGGCLPLLIQFPILIAMFRFFPASIELRQEAFLWADDLSSYDSIAHLPFNIPFYGDHVSLFTLLMAVALFFSSKINYAQSAASSSQAQMPGMKFMMLYMMPVMLLLWFNNYSSGLSYYYLLSNLITIGQTFVFRGMVSDEKLHQRMKENAKKPQKKSKWQERYEQMVKQQQMQQQQSKQKGKK